jgi:hypothetical protein
VFSHGDCSEDDDLKCCQRVSNVLLTFSYRDCSEDDDLKSLDEVGNGIYVLCVCV